MTGIDMPASPRSADMLAEEDGAGPSVLGTKAPPPGIQRLVRQRQRRQFLPRLVRLQLWAGDQM
jgi:hypothetical protein